MIIECGQTRLPQFSTFIKPITMKLFFSITIACLYFFQPGFAQTNQVPAKKRTHNSLFFRPVKTGKMWDTWMYYHNNSFYLYYLNAKDTLQSGVGNIIYDGIGLAISRDGVSWEEKGIVLSKSDSAKGMGTGSVWELKSKKGAEKYIMNFSESRGNDSTGQQCIFFASSDNLVHWTRLEKRFIPDSSLYKINKGLESRWDCIYSITKPGGGRYGYWTANPKDLQPGLGFGETSNGLDWAALPPPVIDWEGQDKLPLIEVGAVEQINGKYYAMMASYIRYNGHRGMFTLESDSPKGPFRPSKKNFKLLTSPPDCSFTYFNRFFRYKGEVLVNHQTLGHNDEVYFGLLKKAMIDKEGTLRLGYWPGNERLKGKKIELETIVINKDSLISFLSKPLETDNGVILEGDFPTLRSNEKSALYIKCETNKGIAVFLKANGQVEFSEHGEEDVNFIVNDKIDRQMKFSSTPHFKLFLKQSLLELYIDNILIQCYTLPDKATGEIGIVSEFAYIKNLAAWEVKSKKTISSRQPFTH